MNIKMKLILKALLVLPAFFAMGCGIWADFTTYFNLYYNATDLFGQAEDAINQQKEDLFSTEEKLIPGSATTNLNKVIDKCSQILQFHKESAYVDDALLMLGKSFFYQRNYLKALREFQELIATQPNSDLILETQLWIGKTQMKLRYFNDAVQTLKLVEDKAIAQGDEEFAKDAYVEEIKYRVSQEDYPGAISLLNNFLKISDDDETNAEIEHELGILYLNQNDLDNAIASFQKVEDYSPTYETAFDSKIELGKALREKGEYKKALEVFDDMRSESKNRDNYDKIDLQRGITLAKLNNYQDAVDLLVNVDTAYTNTESSGLASFNLGNIYEDHYLNFDTAAIYYQKASRSKAPLDYVQKSYEKNNLFRKYLTTRGYVRRFNEQLFYAKNPDQYIKDSTKYVTDSLNYVKDSLRAAEDFERYNELINAISHMDSSKLINDSTAIKDSLLALKDSLNATKDSILIEGKWVALSDTGKISQTKKEQELVQNQKTTGTKKVVKIKKPKLKKPVRPDIPIDSIEVSIAKNELEYGNLFLTEFDLPDSAYKYYMDILENYPDTKYQAQTLYALGSYYLTENKNDKADSLFNIIYNNYQNENIVNAAADKLNKPLIDLNYDPAESIYQDAENNMNDSNYTNTISKFYNIYISYPKSNYAPKALYASGWILENKMDMPDSSASIYDTLMTKYPRSEYSREVAPQMAYYKNEQRKKREAIQDSLKALQTAIADSLKHSDSLHVSNKNEIHDNKEPGQNPNIQNKKELNVSPPDTSKSVDLMEFRRKMMQDSSRTKRDSVRTIQK